MAEKKELEITIGPDGEVHGAGQVHQGRELRRRDQVPRRGAGQHHRVARADRRVLRAAAGRRRRPPRRSSSALVQKRAHAAPFADNAEYLEVACCARCGCCVERAIAVAEGKPAEARAAGRAGARARRRDRRARRRRRAAVRGRWGCRALQRRLGLDDEDVDVLMHAAAAQLDPALGKLHTQAVGHRRSTRGSTSGWPCRCSTTASPSGCARGRAFSRRRRCCAIG